jgi:hypothetical protein
MTRMSSSAESLAEPRFSASIQKSMAFCRVFGTQGQLEERSSNGAADRHFRSFLCAGSSRGLLWFCARGTLTELRGCPPLSETEVLRQTIG